MSNLSFTKLFSSITASSIWQESDQTRLVWITMLAMGDPLGRVHASIPGLAHMSRVSIAATEKALEVFMSPDPYSRSKDNDGRRIEAIEGGWQLINYKAYREKRDPEARKEQNRAAQGNYRQKNSKPIVSHSKPESARVSQCKPPSAQEEGEVEVEEESTKTTTNTLASTAIAVPAARGRLVCTLPLNHGNHEVFEADVQEWVPLYPAVDVRQELRNIKGWLLGNPKLRKTKTGIGRFVNAWLSRAQNEAKPGGGNGNRNQSKTGGNLDAAAQAIAFLEQADRDSQIADEVQPEPEGGYQPGDAGTGRGRLIDLRSE